MENFQVSSSGHMSASGATISGNVSAGGSLSAGNVSMSNNKIQIGGGSIYAAGDGSIFIDPDVTSNTVYCTNLNIGGTVITKDYFSNLDNELTEIWEGISGLWDAIDNLSFVDSNTFGSHTHRYSDELASGLVNQWVYTKSVNES